MTDRRFQLTDDKAADSRLSVESHDGAVRAVQINGAIMQLIAKPSAPAKDLSFHTIPSAYSA